MPLSFFLYSRCLIIKKLRPFSCEQAEIGGIIAMKKNTIFASLFLLLVFCHLPSSLSATSVDLSLEGNTLSVKADNIPLQTILLALSAKGITVKIDPSINHQVTANFSNRPIEQGLETLLKTASYTLLWEGGPDAASPVRLAEIQVFQSGKKDQMRTLQPQRTEVITKNQDGILYVKDELLLYVPAGSNLDRLHELVRSFKGTLVEHKGFSGLFKLLLPENSDVFAIIREIKNTLGLDIAQPNFAYPIQHPTRYPVAVPQENTIPGLFSPTDNSAPIAILDSGIADNTDLNKFVLSTLDVMDPNGPISDTLGHGTQMAFIATGIVKPYGSAGSTESYIPIIPIRTFDENGYTTDFKIMDAINFALENNARVMSLSWGSETKSDFMEKAFAYANGKGLIIVASAGNEPTGKPVYPAAYPSVIGVGALGPHGKTWENSNYGNFVALYAPGFATLPVGHNGDPGLYAGTSISAAFVANAIAGYLSENPAASMQEIRDYLNKKF